jgi:hypothetical protein
MQVPNFHDGHFDGFWLGPNKSVHLFLRTVGKISYTLVLQNVHALTLSGVKTGNIILDLVFRSAQETTPSDMAGLYEVDVEGTQTENLLKSARGRDLQILELNPSYGAQGLILFETWGIKEGTGGIPISTPTTK